MSELPETRHSQDDIIKYLANANAQTDENSRWSILIVDDDRDFVETLVFTLENQSFFGRQLRILTANSYHQACRVMADESDLSVIFLDVVMDTDDAGLKLVGAIRDTYEFMNSRIVLLTGQPGMAPMNNVMADYDISEYWLKTDMTAERLRGVLHANLRSYHHMERLMMAQRGLKLIIQSTPEVLAARSSQQLASVVLRRLASLLYVSNDAAFCVRMSDNASLDDAKIEAAIGKYQQLSGQSFNKLSSTAFFEPLSGTLKNQRSHFDPLFLCIYFRQQEEQCHYAMYLETQRPLEDIEFYLLQVFSSNVSSGFRSVGMISKLDKLAYRDPLLDIGNRNAFCSEVESIKASPLRDQYSILFVDINDFAKINSIFGVSFGDAVLQKVTTRLLEFFDPSVRLHRVGNDMFALVGLTELVSSETIKAAFGPNTLEEHHLDINVSSVLFSMDHSMSEPLNIIAKAGIALEESKHERHDNHVEFDHALFEKSMQRYARIRQLNKAVANDEIHIVIQPQVDIKTEEVIGGECLARWTTCQGEVVPPSDFIPMAEATGLIIPLGEQILHKALKVLEQAITQHNMTKLKLAVNVSMKQIGRGDFIRTLDEALERYSVNRDQVIIETTESAAIDSPELLQKTCRQLCNQGVRIAIDDFGTGFSSLTYLSTLPFDLLKIDRSFVEHMQTPKGEEVIKSIIQLGRKLRKTVLVEGIERRDQAEKLLQMGCQSAQGYYYARPMPVNDFFEFIQQQRS